MLWIATTLAGLFGWDAAKTAKRLYLAIVVIAFLVVCLIFGLIFKACNRPPKLDEKQIQRAEKAIQERNDEKLKEILAESDMKVEQIDSNIKLAEESTRNAKKNYDGMTTDELAAEIERRKNQ